MSGVPLSGVAAAPTPSRMSAAANSSSSGGGPTYTVPIVNPGAETGACSAGTGRSGNTQDWTVTS
jgi:hypothetical protein